MDVSREQPTERSRNMPIEEISRLLRGSTLTPLASQVADAALQSRGLKGLPSTEVVDSVEERPGGRNSRYLVVSGASGAARALLESEGVSAHVWGAHSETE